MLASIAGKCWSLRGQEEIYTIKKFEENKGGLEWLRIWTKNWKTNKA